MTCEARSGGVVVCWGNGCSGGWRVGSIMFTCIYAYWLEHCVKCMECHFNACSSCSLPVVSDFAHCISSPSHSLSPSDVRHANLLS